MIDPLILDKTAAIVLDNATLWHERMAAHRQQYYQQAGIPLPELRIIPEDMMKREDFASPEWTD